MTATILVDALLLTSIATVPLLGGVALLEQISPLRSAHLRHQLRAWSVAACGGVLALLLIQRPDPLGCISRPCTVDAAMARDLGAGALQRSLAAAGKAPYPDPVTLAPPSGRSRVPWIAAIWAAGVALALGRLLSRRIAAAALIRGSVPVSAPAAQTALERLAPDLVRRRGIIREHQAVRSPAVAGLLRPVVLLPPGMADEADLELVLLHEAAHLRRRDTLTHLLMECVAAALWFLPWLPSAVRRVRESQELAADSRVVAAGVGATRYAQYLLEALRALGAAPQPIGATHSIIGDCLMEHRIRSILDPATRHAAPGARLTGAIAALFAAITLVLAAAPAPLRAWGLLPQQQRGGGPVMALLNSTSLDSLIRPVAINTMTDRYIAGAAVAVVSGDQVIYLQGFGRREVYHEVPVDAERTIWRIGSITKALTAMAVLQLSDRGRIRLDADVNDYLTTARVPAGAGFSEPVRVRHLLTHTAGFDQPGTGRHARSQSEVQPLSAFLGRNLIRIRPPGQLAVYDTYGITLAGHLVEQVSGMSFEAYLQRELFEPLGMHRSGIEVPRALAGDVAVGYEFAGRYEAPPWEYMNTAPASTVNASAGDMANLMVMLLNEGRFRGRQLLQPATVRAMLTRQFGNDPEQPGYGYIFWEDRSFGLPAWSHGGSMTGYGAMLYLIPEHRIGIFVACNQESGTLANAVIAELVTALFPNAAPPSRRADWSGTDDARRFAGSYANTMHNHGNPDEGWRRRPIAVTMTDSGLVALDRRAARRVGPLSFQRPDGSLVTFRENARREITHMFIGQAAFERLGP